MIKRKKRKKRDSFISSSEVQRGMRKDRTRTEGVSPAKDRPQGFKKKTPVPYREMKQGMIEIFNKSNAKAILLGMLNMKIPYQLKPIDFDENDAIDDRMVKDLMLTNFKWAVSQIIKLAPKEVGIFGSVKMEHSLAGLTRRATMGEKSGKVIDLVKERRERELLTQGNERGSNGQGAEIWESEK